MAVSAGTNPPSDRPLSIVILGCGRVGSTLARQLSRDGHHVTIIDHTSDAFRRLGPRFKGKRIIGAGLDQDTLRKAETAQADTFIAVTQGDNTNIMAAQLAKEIYSVPRVVARIYDPIRAHAYREMGINTLCTTTLAAEVIRKQVESGGEDTVVQFAENADCSYMEMIG